MRRFRVLFVSAGLVLAGLVLQTTVFRRIQILAPDLVLLVVIIAALKLGPEAALLLGFGAGLIVDLSVANTVLGLRAITYTTAAFLAIRTRHRTSIGGPVVGAWIGLLTLAARALFLLLGTLFGQSSVIGGQLVRQLALVPITNAVLGGLLAVPIGRALGRGTRR
jgi:rod shape-determining protein MreD